jgi:hypothetical protein
MEQFVAGGSGDESAQFDTLSDIDAAICSPTDRGRWNQWVGVLSVFLQYALSGGFQLQCRIRKPQKKGKK